MSEKGCIGLGNGLIIPIADIEIFEQYQGYWINNEETLDKFNVIPEERIRNYWRKLHNNYPYMIVVEKCKIPKGFDES